MKHLLIITNNYPPSKTIGTQRILRICKFLDRTKWNISVLTLKENYYPFPEFNWDDPQYRFLKDISVYRTHRFDLVNLLIDFRDRLRAKKVKQNSTPSKAVANQNGAIKQQTDDYRPAAKNGSAWQTIKDMVTDMMQFPDSNITWLPVAVWKGRKIIKKNKVDVIFSTSPHHSLHLITAILKMLSGKKLIIDFRDPWARSPWHNKIRVASAFERWKHRRIISMEKWVVKKADGVSLITEEMQKDYIRNYPKLPPEKFNLFNNGFDPETLQVNKNGQVNQQDKATSKVTFIHAGSLYKERDPTPILYALKNLFDQNKISRDRISFVFMGAVTYHLSHIQSLTAELGLTDVVTFVSKVSYRESIDRMANSDVLILLQPVTKLQLPGKFYDYICLGKPILAVAEKDSAVENMVKDRFGVFANIQDVADIEKGILFLSENPTFNIESIKEHREKYDMSKSIHIFEDILDNSEIHSHEVAKTQSYTNSPFEGG